MEVPTCAASLADGKSRSNRNAAIFNAVPVVSLADGKSRSNRNGHQERKDPPDSLADGKSRSNRNVWADAGEILVVPEAWPAVPLLMACATQWRIGPSGYLAGLDYRACMAAAKGIDVNWRDVFEYLRIMEGEALVAQGERKW